MGKVWLVGAGPSDEGLFTIKGKQVLEQAEVVIFDQLVGQGILNLIPKEAEKINVGKRAGNHPVPQEEINEILLQKALEGKRVVRLKGGDPFLFGRGGEELEALVDYQIPFEIVPGITSAISVPAYAGIPVTHRDFCSSVHIITAHKKRGSKEGIDYDKLVGLDGTLVFLMGVGALEEICRGLIKAGMQKEMPAAILEKGTTAKQRTIVATICTLPEQTRKEKIQTPAIIVVGKVCELAKRFHWAEDRPLGGKRVIVTRPKRVSSQLVNQLLEYGAEVVQLPLIQTVSIKDNTLLKEQLEQIQFIQWIVFTSEVGVTLFFDTLLDIKKDIRNLSSIRFAVVGEATKQAVESRGILVDYMPEQYSGKALGEGLIKQITPEDRILVGVPKNIKSDCISILREHNKNVVEVPLYETIYEENCEIVLEETDYVAFTSASTVKGFVNIIKGYDFTKVNAFCIGEQTANEARKYGMNITISKEATIASLVQAML